MKHVVCEQLHRRWRSSPTFCNEGMADLRRSHRLNCRMFNVSSRSACWIGGVGWVEASRGIASLLSLSLLVTTAAMTCETHNSCNRFLKPKCGLKLKHKTFSLTSFQSTHRNASFRKVSSSGAAAGRSQQKRRSAWQLNTVKFKSLRLSCPTIDLQ